MIFEIKGLTKSYGNKPIINNFSLTLDGTGLYILTGKSGVGKTTLLRIIAGIDKKYVGSVTSIKSGDVSFAFQEYRLFDTLNAIDNVRLGARDDSSFMRARTLLSDLNFTPKDMYLFPRELSGGMKQRVSLARAFFHPSRIILLDEPTKELDQGNVKRVHELIKKEARCRLIIMVTHKDEDIEELSDMCSVIELKNT